MAQKKAMRLQGDLQLGVMRAVWRLGRGSVEEVRRALPAGKRGAYTTVQTVLNRLADRGLLERHRQRNVILYEARVSEADFYSRSVRETLQQASADARRSALAKLVGDLAPAERDEIEALAEQVARKRRGSKP